LQAAHKGATAKRSYASDEGGGGGAADGMAHTSGIEVQELEEDTQTKRAKTGEESSSGSTDTGPPSIADDFGEETPPSPAPAGLSQQDLACILRGADQPSTSGLDAATAGLATRAGRSDVNVLGRDDWGTEATTTGGDASMHSYIDACLASWGDQTQPDYHSPGHVSDLTQRSASGGQPSIVGNIAAVAAASPTVARLADDALCTACDFGATAEPFDEGSPTSPLLAGPSPRDGWGTKATAAGGDASVDSFALLENLSPGDGSDLTPHSASGQLGTFGNIAPLAPAYPMAADDLTWPADSGSLPSPPPAGPTPHTPVVHRSEPTMAHSPAPPCACVTDQLKQKDLEISQLKEDNREWALRCTTMMVTYAELVHEVEQLKMRIASDGSKGAHPHMGEGRPPTADGAVQAPRITRAHTIPIG
jgi:hypothetical protein